MFLIATKYSDPETKSHAVHSHSNLPHTKWIFYPLLMAWSNI
jgi:hypothetical protein